MPKRLNAFFAFSFILATIFGWNMETDVLRKRVDSLETSLTAVNARLASVEMFVAAQSENTTAVANGDTLEIALTRLTKKLKIIVPVELQKTILFHVKTNAEIYNLDPVLLLAIIAHESRFDPNIIGSCGEIGLMQIHIPSWRRHYGLTHDAFKQRLFDPGYNIATGAEIFNQCLDKKHGNVWQALKCYNGGNAYPPKVLRLYAIAKGE